MSLAAQTATSQGPATRSSRARARRLERRQKRVAERRAEIGADVDFKTATPQEKIVAAGRSLRSVTLDKVLLSLWALIILGALALFFRTTIAWIFLAFFYLLLGTTHAWMFRKAVFMIRVDPRLRKFHLAPWLVGRHVAERIDGAFASWSEGRGNA